jgi:RNA polymerase sigma factor (sigma-70 family)
VELDRYLASYVADPSSAVDRQLAIAQALASLTRRERVVVVLRFVEDLTEVQTAASLGLALGTIKSTTARALKKLRADPELSSSYVGDQR